MEDVDFLSEREWGTLTVRLASRPLRKSSIDGIDLDLLIQQAPSLRTLIDATGRMPVLDMSQKASRAAVIGLLRFVYVDDYRFTEALFEKPCSLLLHLQMYKLGEMYNLPELVQLAYLHSLRECELACSLGLRVIDLCEAIRFFYLELAHAEPLSDIIANYCVQYWTAHGLCEDEAFRQTVYEAPVFHRLLVKSAMLNDFAADGSSDLVTMSVCNHPAHLSQFSEVRHAANFMCAHHTDDIRASKSESHTSPWTEPSSEPFVLVSWPRSEAEPQVLPDTPLNLPVRSRPAQPGNSLNRRGNHVDLSDDDVAGVGSSMKASVSTIKALASSKHAIEPLRANATKGIRQEAQSDSDWSLVEDMSTDGEKSNKDKTSPRNPRKSRNSVDRGSADSGAPLLPNSPHSRFEIASSSTASPAAYAQERRNDIQGAPPAKPGSSAWETDWLMVEEADDIDGISW